MASDDEDVPDTGAVFTFGKTRFADNLASKFWIRDDPVVQVACGDEHSAIITAKGKLYTFGSNDWGQLGHGNTKPYNKPSVVKKLKPEKSYLVACGRNHTLVATESGKLYSFGCGGDGQLGHEDSESLHEPKAIELLDSQRYSLLACGSDFSAAVTDNGILYTWGSGSEGQNGLGEDTESPKRLYLSGKVVSVACGYYHMAVVTDEGALYTCGEHEGGKLGLEKSHLDDTSQLQKVESIKEKVTAVSCGAEFTVAVTENGHVYSFGQGNQGQLGLGPALSECKLPEKVQAFNKVKAKSVECGESFTAIITKHGNLYTFGDGRHGKLGLGDECFSNLFKPQKVSRFNNFIVTKVSCGGCHMLVSAVRKEESVEESDSEEQAENETSLGATLKPGQLLDAIDGPSHFSSTWSARDKRRQKHVEDINNSLSHSLPPINKSSLPPLNGTLRRTLPALGKANLNEEEKKPVNPLNASKLPKITNYDDEEGDKTTPKSQSSPKSSPRPLPRGQTRPSPLAAPRALPRTKKDKDETESEEESGSEEESDEEEEEGQNGKSGKQEKEGEKKKGESEKEVKKQAKEEEESEEDEDEDEEESETDEDEDQKKHSKKATVKDKTTKAATTSKDSKKMDEEEEEDDEESEEEDEEDEEDDNKNKKKPKKKMEDKKETKSKKIEVGSSGKKDEEDSEEEEEGDDEEEEEGEEDKDAKKKKKKKDSKEDGKGKKKKSKKKSKDEDKETEDDETTEETTGKTKKGKKKGKKKKEETKEDEEEEEDEDEDKDKEKEKTEEDKKEEDSKNKESTKKAAKQKDKKSGICVLI